MLGHGATGQFAIGQVATGGTAETIAPDKWYAALSEPVRKKLGLIAGVQQFVAFAPNPVVSFSWFGGLAEPIRTIPRAVAGERQFLALYPTPSPFVATGWFAPLSEPVRQIPGLPAALRQFFTTDTTAIPVTKLIEWFAAFSEPVRVLQGLKPWHQQFLAYHPRLQPNPTITGTLSAIETKDVFLAGGISFNRSVSGEIGIVEQSGPLGEVGMAERPVPGTQAISGGGISVSAI